MNVVKAYEALADKLLPYVIARPLRLVYEDGANRLWARTPTERMLREPEQGAYPVQVWSMPDLLGLLRDEQPIEIHHRSAAFFEYSRNFMVFDLDTAKHSGVQTSFRWGKRFLQYLVGREEVAHVRMLFTGNRGFHLRTWLRRRHEPEIYDKMVKDFVDGFGEPFLGEVDTLPCKREHYVRCPHSYNVKGSRFSFFVETLDDFTPEIADQLNAALAVHFGAVSTPVVGGEPCAVLR